MNWLAFWDSPHSIYVSARHKDVHYRVIAEAIAALVPSREARVLDYGSGEALHADIVAAACGQLKRSALRHGSAMRSLPMMASPDASAPKAAQAA